MRKLIVPAAVLAVCLAASVSRAGIVGSAHDFSGSGWAQGEICKPCHTPHFAILKDAQGAEIAAPLWNHTLSTATYTMYDHGEEVPGEVDQNSKLCLSCHDGTVALDSFGGKTGTNMIPVSAKIGTNLADDHPIGEMAIWPAVGTSAYNRMVTPDDRSDPTKRTDWADIQARAAAAGVSSPSSRVMPLRPMADGQLAVGCTTCHEPHNRNNKEHMLWISNSGKSMTNDGRLVNGSGLCLNCHRK